MRPIITARVAARALAACLPLWAASVPAIRAEECADGYVDKYVEKHVDEHGADAPALADAGFLNQMNSVAVVVANSHAPTAAGHDATRRFDEHVEELGDEHGDEYGGDAPAFPDSGMLHQAAAVVLAKSPALTLEGIAARGVDVTVKQAGASSVDGLGVALAPDQLELYRGGSDTVFNDMKLNGIVSDNSATNVVTGSNMIGEGSFSNASGLSTVIQNSGANVLIQNATIINVQMK